MKQHEIRTCVVCGAKFSATSESEFCPVCMLHKAALGLAESGESSFEEAAKTTPDQPSKRFDHYELATGEDGKPVELGRGAMGVTYKAFDINLHCPVTLKVISKRYLGDKSARVRFLREARGAAKLRHSNVASVLHLGKSAGTYFYAMEFVEGETLDHLVKRSGRLDAKLALEIAVEVAAGLAAVHEQHLVHQDIKPTNIMVRLNEQGSVTAKIIDLGLAKTLGDSASEAGISSPGAFVGTPEFASPEQFGGVGVDIRSDLYSLGVTLWVMVTGQTPFRGLSAEMMYQHQRGSLPLELLKDVPQPVTVLLEKLLEKNPAERFRTPSELLKAIPTVRGAIESRRRITRQSLQKTPFTGSRVGTGKPPAKPGPDKISVARLPVREQLRSQPADAWKESNRRLYNHHRSAAPQLPDTFRDMEPPFLAKRVHFRGVINGQETDTVQGTTQSVDGETTGIATQFGQLSFNYDLTVNLTNGTGTGSAQLQTANGDIIYTTIAGQFELTSTPGVGSITEINTITGGTGRFVGAQGNFTMERLLNLAGAGLQQTAYFTSGWFHGTYYFPGQQAVE